MSDYGKLMSRIWGDKEFTALNAREQQVFMMLFSFPTKNLAGVLPVTLRRWATVTSDATMENITAALKVLVHARFIIIDWDTEEVLIRTYIRNDEVWKQPNLMVRCLKYCADVASEVLKAAICEELNRIAQELMPTDKPAQKKIREDTLQAAKTLVKTFADGFQEPLWKPFEEPSLNPTRKVFAEPMGEPPGVGGYVSSQVSPPPAPASAPASATAPDVSSKRGNRLSADWHPADNEAMHEKFPDVDLDRELEKFRDHWLAKSGQDATKLDWEATWRNWVRRTSERIERDGSAGTRLPEGWQPPDDVIRAMHEQFPDLNLRHHHEKFVDYWTAKAGKDGVKLDWVATWRNWIRSAAERQGSAAPRQSASERAVTEVDALRDNPRLAQNQNRRFDALFPTDRKELTDGS